MRRRKITPVVSVSVQFCNPKLALCASTFRPQASTLILKPTVDMTVFSHLDIAVSVLSLALLHNCECIQPSNRVQKWCCHSGVVDWSKVTTIVAVLLSVLL
jgi:hypothetical protein